VGRWIGGRVVGSVGECVSGWVCVFVCVRERGCVCVCVTTRVSGCSVSFRTSE